MPSRNLVRPVLPFLWTIAPVYGIERIADYYFLTDNQAFYLISGWRLEIFILSFLIGSVAAGAFLKSFKLAFLSESAAFATILLLLYFACDPKVCFSSAPDGFEPLRFGFFLGSVATSGASIGAAYVGEPPKGALSKTLAAVAIFVAIAWYPVVFTFAGTVLLSPFGPWGVLGTLFLLSAATVIRSTEDSVLKGIAIPIVSIFLSFIASAGIATSYIGSIVPLLLLITASSVLGTLAGFLFSRVRGNARPQRSLGRALTGASVALVLLMTLVIIPDAVAGVTPTNESSGTNFTMGSPVYEGAYMAAPQSHALGVGVNVSFSGTNPNEIPSDNYLAAGIGVHAAGCCTDGIDYAYRFDAYVLRGGSVSFLASAWEACDDNAACGGHSWKVLMYSKSASVGSAALNGFVRLGMVWQGGSVVWSYSTNGTSTEFADFEVPPAENHNFNTGVSSGVSLSSQKEAYFYQFGVMSGHPIEQPIWRVVFKCPAVLMNGQWACIGHAGTLRGYDSYWKVIWRWGEEYPGVNVATVGPHSAQFEYNGANATEDLRPLW